jgi:hypothetical protein
VTQVYFLLTKELISVGVTLAALLRNKNVSSLANVFLKKIASQMADDEAA